MTYVKFNDHCNSVFIMLAFIEKKLNQFLNEHARKKKAKISESCSFSVRYRRTYAVNNGIQIFSVRCRRICIIHQNIYIRSLSFKVLF